MRTFKIKISKSDKRQLMNESNKTCMSNLFATIECSNLMMACDSDKYCSGRRISR